MCRGVSIPGKIEKAVVFTVEVLRSSCKPVLVPRMSDNAVSTVLAVMQACFSARKDLNGDPSAKSISTFNTVLIQVTFETKKKKMGVPNFMEGSLISYEIGDPGP